MTRQSVPRARSALRTLVQLAWSAGPRYFAVVAAAQCVFAASMAARIVLVTGLLGGLSSPDHKALVEPLVVLGVVFALGSCAQLVQRESGRLLGELVVRAALDRVLDAAQSASLVLFDDAQFHDRLGRVQLAQSRCSQALSALFTGLGAALGAVGVLLGLSSVSFLLLPIAMLGSIPAAVAARRNSEDEYFFLTRLMPTEQQRSYVESLLIDRGAAKEIRAFDLAPFLRALHGRLFDERLEGLRALAKQRMRRLLRSSLLTSIGSAATAAALLSLYFTGRMSLTTAGAAIFGFAMLKGQLTAVSGSMTDLYESLLFVGELDDFANEMATSRPAVERGAPPIPTFGGVRMEDVVFTYPTARRPAVRDITLRVDPGEVIALVGPNGSGKTTVAKLLAGLYAPERGSILWSGIDRSTLDTKTLSQKIAIGFQDFERFRLSVSDNIAFGRQRPGPGHDVVAAAERAGALSFVTALPHGFDTPLGPELDGGAELSQGQWQRLALARVFFRDAELVILDEPTAALDALAESELFETMRRGLEGRCAVVICHRLATVRTADRIYVFQHGRIVDAGNHRELLARAGLYARMYELQASAYTGEAIAPLRAAARADRVRAAQLYEQTTSRATHMQPSRTR